jgi:hypothetical protein
MGLHQLADDSFGAFYHSISANRSFMRRKVRFYKAEVETGRVG